MLDISLRPEDFRLHFAVSFGHARILMLRTNGHQQPALHSHAHFRDALHRAIISSTTGRRWGHLPSFAVTISLQTSSYRSLIARRFATRSSSTHVTWRDIELSCFTQYHHAAYRTLLRFTNASLTSPAAFDFDTFLIFTYFLF
jgi:hypothetical protein